MFKDYVTHGDGTYNRNAFKGIGENVILENGVLVFHPENITIGNNVYIGHNTILKGYYKNELYIGDNTWIGQGCFFHSAGGLKIGNTVGIGPMVKILTSQHASDISNKDVMRNNLIFKKVEICEGADIGVGAIILPGVKIGEGAIIAAGSVITKDIPEFTIYGGVPAKFLRNR